MTAHTAEEPNPGDGIPEHTGADEAELDAAGPDEAESGTDEVPAEDGPARTDETGDPPSDDPLSDAKAYGDAKPAPFYTRLEDFVDGHFVQLICRPLGGEFRWCTQWWRHAEAISRLKALWHAWEALRQQPGTGIGIWYRDHLDHQLPVLLGARGPFFQCSEDEHIEPHRLRSAPAPPDWWT